MDCAAPVLGETYQITVTVVTTTPGSLVIGFGGVSAPAIGQANGTLTAYTLLLNVAGAGSGLTFTPNASSIAWHALI